MDSVIPISQSPGATLVTVYFQVQFSSSLADLVGFQLPSNKVAFIQVSQLQSKNPSSCTTEQGYSPRDVPAHQASTVHRVLESPIQLTGLIHLFQFFKNISLTSSHTLD